MSVASSVPSCLVSASRYIAAILHQKTHNLSKDLVRIQFRFWGHSSPAIGFQMSEERLVLRDHRQTEAHNSFLPAIIPATWVPSIWLALFLAFGIWRFSPCPSWSCGSSSGTLLGSAGHTLTVLVQYSPSSSGPCFQLTPVSNQVIATSDLEARSKASSQL